MNPNHVLSLLQDDYTTIGAMFVDGRNTREYTYKILRADQPKVGEHCVVKSQYTQSGYAIVEISRVDDEPEINTSAQYDYSWVIQKIDPKLYNELFEIERKFAKEVRAIERQHMRKQAAEQLLGQFPEGSESRMMLETLLKTVRNPLTAITQGETHGDTEVRNSAGSTEPNGSSGNAGNA